MEDERGDGRTDLDIVGHAVVAIGGAVDRGVLALVGAAEAVRPPLEVHLREVDVDVGAVRRVQPHAAVKIVRVAVVARVGVAAVS